MFEVRMEDEGSAEQRRWGWEGMADGTPTACMEAQR